MVNHAGLSAYIYLLSVTYLHKTMKDLLVCQLCISQHGASTLDWLDDLAGLVAGESETCCARVNLHGASKCLLGSCCHAVRLIQNNNFVSSSGQCHFLLRKGLDLVSNDIDSTIDIIGYSLLT